MELNRTLVPQIERAAEKDHHDELGAHRSWRLVALNHDEWRK